MNFNQKKAGAGLVDIMGVKTNLAFLRLQQPILVKVVVKTEARLHFFGALLM